MVGSSGSKQSRRIIQQICSVVWSLDLDMDLEIALEYERVYGYSRRHDLAFRISHPASRISFASSSRLSRLFCVFPASSAQFLPPPLHSASSFVRFFFSRWSNSKKGGVQGYNPRHSN
jgi:hypothetical protein